MLNVRPYNNKQQLLFPPSIGDYLPKNHLVRVIDEVVEQIDLEPYYQKIPKVGNPSYHPAMMIKIWFYGYCVRTYSSRKIEEKLYTDLAFIYLAGMQKPDFKTISEFRRKHIDELKQTFVEILKICHRLGMTKLGNIAIDSKVMKANASANRTYTERELLEEEQELESAIQEYLERANQTDEEEDRRYGSERLGNEIPEDIQDREKRIKKMREIVEQLRQAREKLKSSEKKKINLTDSDAQFQRDKSRKIPGYRAQIAVDSEQQVIVANDVSTKQADQRELLPMINQVIENVDKVRENLEDNLFHADTEKEEEKINIIADSGYSSCENLAELEGERYKGRIEAYIPDQRYQARERNRESLTFDKERFVYDEERDEFICPLGKRLYYMGKAAHRGKQRFKVYRCRECKGCIYFGDCTSSPRGRTIKVLENQHLYEQMRDKLSSMEGKRIYALRKVTVEPVFGNLVKNLGFSEFLLRGLHKVRGEFSLMCSAHNLLKIARFIKRLGCSLREALKIGNPTLVLDT